MGTFRKFTHASARYSNPNTDKPLEHWYRDNTIYFITARCRDRYPAFETDRAKQIFWDRFNHWSNHYRFIPFVTTLMNNHYHTEGYLKFGENLGSMMQRIHGSIAKLVNDVLPERHLPFWRESGSRDYFDGCIRDESRCKFAYRYTLNQSVRAGISRNASEYPDTHVSMTLEDALKFAKEKHSYMEDVEYKRYKRNRNPIR